MNNLFFIFMGSLTMLAAGLLFVVSLSGHITNKICRAYAENLSFAGLILMLGGAVLVSFLPGCAAIEKYGNAVTNAGIAHEAISSGEVEASIKSIALTADEENKVNAAKKRYEDFIAKWSESIGDFDGLAGRMQSFDADYRLLQAEYDTLSGIISANWWRYSPEQKANLNDYQSRAEKLDESVQAFISAKKGHQALMDALTFSAMILKVVL